MRRDQEFGLFLAVLLVLGMFATPAMAETTLSPAPGNYSGAVCVRASSDDAAVTKFNYFKDGKAVSVTGCLMLSGGDFKVKAVGFDKDGAAVADEEASGDYTAGLAVTADSFGSTDDAFGHRKVTITVTKKGGGKKGAAKKPAASAPSPFKFKARSPQSSIGLIPSKKCTVDGTDAEGNPKLKCEDNSVDIYDVADDVASAAETYVDDAVDGVGRRVEAVETDVAALKSELAATKPKAKPGMQIAAVANYSDFGLEAGGETAVKYCFGRFCPLAGGGLGTTTDGLTYRVFGGALVPFGPDVDGLFLAEGKFRRADDADADSFGARAGFQLGIVGPAYAEFSLFVGEENADGEDAKAVVNGQGSLGVRF